MASFKERRRRRRGKQERRKQELLDRGLEAFEAKHAELIPDLEAVGHDPYVAPKWVETGQAPAGWQFSLRCRKCRQRYRSWVPKRLSGLSPDKPCEGVGPTFDEWAREGLEGYEASEGDAHTVVEVRARTAAEATSLAISQLGLPADQVEITVADEGKLGSQAVVWARPKAG